MTRFLEKIEVANRKAYHDYFVLERLECGIALVGSEVKSVRRGGVNLRHSYALFRGSELFVLGMSIAQYKESGVSGHEPQRPRKLLAHKRELIKLRSKIEEKGFTLIPLRLYVSKGRVKVEIGLCKGKREYDKRETIKRRDQERDDRRQVY
jgi:SsrA-binding protein